MKELRTYDGHVYEVTEDMAALINQQIAKGNKFIVVFGDTLAVANISSIASKQNKYVDRSKQIEGVLHDGTRVVKQFGRWMVADGERDESGRLAVEPRSENYPELNLGVLPTVEEFANEFQSLQVGEWEKKLLGADPERPLLIEKRTEDMEKL